ncbi:MAG: T9SS C-terminal target domain-containing protein [Bacteroidia bacterium]|nr:MAG: T9SS C-terminal target domain-containing protein [Bacteroidia bacterium]
MNQTIPHAAHLLIFLLFACAGLPHAQAQQGAVAAGGEITGPGGSLSFSTGQTDFMFFSSEAGSIQFGLQQVFFFDDEPQVPLTRHLTTADIFQGEDLCFDATHTITLAGGSDTFIVEDGTSVDLIAGYRIRMLPGTRVEHGGHLHARISPEGVFCDVEEPIVVAMQAGEQETTAYQEPLNMPGEEPSEKPLFRVYPNPTSGDFTVELNHTGLPGQPVTIEIIGMRGEVVMRYDLSLQRDYQLSLQGHQPGLYVVRVQSGDQFGIERIIKR